MSSQGSATKDETTKLENSTYNILIALGKEARFLYSAIDTYIDDARKDNNSDLQNMWKTIKQETLWISKQKSRNCINAMATMYMPANDQRCQVFFCFWNDFLGPKKGLENLSLHMGK
jgi:hypothetical protein